MISKIKKILFFIIFYFFLDLLFSYFLLNLVFTNLEKIYQSELENRIFHKDYKYTFKNSTSYLSRYNDFIYKITTNNFGFRDEIIQNVKPKKGLIFLAGDSFLEGVGLEYEHTLSGHLKNKNIKGKTFLNSGVASYSTYLYKKKIISFIENNKNFNIERVIVFFDKSDPIDDQQYILKPVNFIDSKKDKKYKKNLSEKSITFAVLKIIGNYLDETRRNLKYRYLISKKYNQNFFDLTYNQVIAFKSIGNRRFISNYYTDEKKWQNQTKNFLSFSLKNLEELSEYLNKKNIPLDIFLYPWSFELMNEKVRKNYIDYLNKINDSKKLNINSCYDYFIKESPLEQLEFIGQNFLYADIHFGSPGYKIMAECVGDKIQF